MWLGSREMLWRIHPAATSKDQATLKMVHFSVFEGVGRGGKWNPMANRRT